MPVRASDCIHTAGVASSKLASPTTKKISIYIKYLGVFPDLISRVLDYAAEQHRVI